MSAIDKLKARLELKSFDSKALGTVYYKPITLIEQEAIGLGDDKIPMSKKLSIAALMKALDASGVRLFKDDDEKELTELCSVEDVAEIANGVLESKTVEDQLGE